MSSKRIFPELVSYTPEPIDMAHIEEIEAFLSEESIPYEKDDVFGLYHLNERALQLRYINSTYYPIDNQKRFGPEHKGVPANIFLEASLANADRGIRTIWIFDFEMEQMNPGTSYRRQWEVIKNTIRTACHRIRTRIYARDCEAREISNVEARPFLNTNCFYGYRSATNTVALFLKKDKAGIPAGTMLMVYSFGHGFYANKQHMEDPSIEIIRVSTLIGVQVIGGMSKCLKHFLESHPTMEIAGKTVEVNKLIFYCDASHNDGRGMQSTGLNFNFVGWKEPGFMNRYLEDVDVETPDGKRLRGKKGEIFHRKPMYHKLIMQLIKEHKVISIPNAGTSVYNITRQEFLDRFKDSGK